MSMGAAVEVANILRETHPDMERIFTRGGCYQFVRIARAVEPLMSARYCEVEGHAFAAVGAAGVDITGAFDWRERYPEARLLSAEPRFERDAPHWHAAAFWVNPSGGRVASPSVPFPPKSEGWRPVFQRGN